MTARRLVVLALAGWAAGPVAQSPTTRSNAFSVVEATIPDMQRAMAQHRVTSRELVTQYLTRIALYEKRIHAAISINPRALEEADARAADRARGRVRGPLHGIPIALKDNIHTIDMPTTGGALSRSPISRHRMTRRCGRSARRRRGNHRENRADRSSPTGCRRADADAGKYSAVGGFAFKPVRPMARPAARKLATADPCWSTGGSSSGAGTAAAFWAANVGSDTAGSIVNPAQLTMLVGIRPTTGRISRARDHPDHRRPGHRGSDGADRDRTLRFCSGARRGRRPDPNDAATRRCTPPPGRDYTKFLKPDGLRGAYRHPACGLLLRPPPGRR
jgi:amidase